MNGRTELTNGVENPVAKVWPLGKGMVEEMLWRHRLSWTACKILSGGGEWKVKQEIRPSRLRATMDQWKTLSFTHLPSLSHPAGPRSSDEADQVDYNSTTTYYPSILL